MKASVSKVYCVSAFPETYLTDAFIRFYTAENRNKKTKHYNRCDIKTSQKQFEFFHFLPLLYFYECFIGELIE